MKKSRIVQRLLDPGIVAVIRADDSSQLLHVARALVKGGVESMEITMTTPNAIEVIREVVGELGDSILMGVGTVLDDITARMAILAGAEFVVTPTLRPDVIALCRRYGKPVISGSYTPTEALAAQEAGADFIKLFPADGLGPQYIRNLLAPLPQLEIIPTGGVTVDTCTDFLAAGCAAVAAGSSLVTKDALKAGDWNAITERAAAFVGKIRAFRDARH